MELKFDEEKGYYWQRPKDEDRVEVSQYFFYEDTGRLAEKTGLIEWALKSIKVEV